MRADSLRLVLGCGLATAALTLAGCGSDKQDTNVPTPNEATVDTSGAQVEVGNTVNYGSFGTTAEVDCADGKSLNVAGSNNNLTVKGKCASVIIGGAGNTIDFKRIDGELRVIGLNNKVTYEAGDPNVNDIGSGNSITKK